MEKKIYLYRYKTYCNSDYCYFSKRKLYLTKTGEIRQPQHPSGTWTIMETNNLKTKKIKIPRFNTITEVFVDSDIVDKLLPKL